MFVIPLQKTKMWLRQNLNKKTIFIYNHYSDIIKMIAHWQMTGVKINKDKFYKLKHMVEQKIVKILEEINSLDAVKKFKKKYGKDFNIKSVQQLNDLAKILKIKPLYKTSSGLISFSTKYLPDYINNHSGEAKRFLELLKDFRFYSKALLSYINSIPESLDSNWIFRTEFNICGTKTGRLSSYFHTLPSRSEFGKNFKRLLESRWQDGLIVSFDFSQAEPRTIASLSGDKKLIQVYIEGKDIYKTMASVVYNISYNDVPKDLRNKMKQLVLAVLYGMSPKTFAKNTNITVNEAEKILKKFFEEFKEVANWIKNQHIYVQQHRHIKTPLKRIIKLPPELFLTDKHKVLRDSQNFPIQSTASETILIIIKEFWKFLNHYNYKSKIVGSVHDSVIIDTKLEELFDIIFYSKLFFENYFVKYFEFIKTPVKIDIAIGVSWGNSLEIKSMAFDTQETEIVCEGYIEDLLFLLDKLSLKYKVSYDIIREEDIELEEEILLINNKQKLGEYRIKIYNRR